MASSDSQIDKLRGRLKRAELLDVNINTGAQSINTERASLNLIFILPANFPTSSKKRKFLDPFTFY